MKTDDILRIMAILTIWIFFSFIASVIKDARGNCGKDYPIDYVFCASLFCEIKD